MTPDATLDLTRLTVSPPVAAPEAAEAIRVGYRLTGELTRLPGEPTTTSCSRSQAASATW